MNIRTLLAWATCLQMHFAFAIDARAQTWPDLLGPSRIPDAKREAPRPKDLDRCRRGVTYPDSLAITGGIVGYIDVWKAVDGIGVWQPLITNPSPPDTLRVKVVGSDCGLYSPFNLVLQHEPYWLRLRAGAIPSMPEGESVSLIDDQKALEPAMWTVGDCDSCSFRVVSAKRFADSTEKAEAIARKVARDSSRARAERLAIEQQRMVAGANRRDSLAGLVGARIDAEQARERKRENAAAEKARVTAIRRKNWPSAITDAVIARNIKLGMTHEQVRAAWGEPDETHRTVTAYTVDEQWVYGSQYVYFEHGVVTAWQD